MLPRFIRFGFATALLSVAVAVLAVDTTYHRVVGGVAIYLGMIPAEMARGHPREHPEGTMHGGVPAGENHLTVALFGDKTGERIARAEITATITGPDRFKTVKKLEPMTIAGSATYGNYFFMPGPGPYRIVLRIRLPGAGRDVEAVFTWARS